MATSTFDKNIYIDDAAADVLIGLLNKPAPLRPDVSGKFRDLTEEDIECCLRNRLARSSNILADKLPNDITLASEKALAKDWLLPEEEEAWANL